MIPVRHVQAGAELSPPLTWAGGPNGTVSHVLLVHDLDSPQGNDNLLNWLLWNIPGDATGLPEGVSQGPELPNGTRQISVSGPYFRGPAAPPTVKARHLLFEIFALDTMIDVAPVGASPAATRAAVMAAMAGHVRGKGVLFGLYGLPR
jgi:Raf kinase inhibitor-like YbhB/YbcL family protein